jgi:hypothetical protein
MQEVKIRLVNPALSPRRTKLEMPGWAGQPEPRADGAQEYAWHCAPFTEGAQYGIEVFYPYDNELRVSKQQGKLVLDGDFGPRPQEIGDLMWPPFRSFGQDYYTYQLLLDLKVGKDWRYAPNLTHASIPIRPIQSPSPCRHSCAPNGGR